MRRSGLRECDGRQSLDLLQFHWWEYDDARYLDALKHLADLQHEGRIKHLALTNFDTEHLRTITEQGTRIVSNQVQYSLVDRRPEVQMAVFCRDHGIALLAYGTVLGGLLSEKFLGRPEPRRGELNADLSGIPEHNRPMGRMGALPGIARRAQADRRQAWSDIANAGVRYILERPAVAGVILGTRLGVAQHLDDNARVFGFATDGEDDAKIETVLSKSRNLSQLMGDCGDEYR